MSTPTVSRFEGGEKDIQLSSALAILRVLGLTDHRTLVFPEPQARYNNERTSVIFWGSDGINEVRCVISREALDDHFGGDKNPDKLKAFLAHQQAIEHEARREFLAGVLEPGGSVLIKTVDLDTMPRVTRYR